MSSVPIGLLTVLALTLTFEAAALGQDVIAQSFPPLYSVSISDCTATGIFAGFSYLGCVVGNVVMFVANVFLIIGGLVLFVGNLITFNVPGAPTVVRFPIAIALCGSLTWAVVMLFRGN